MNASSKGQCWPWPSEDSGANEEAKHRTGARRKSGSAWAWDPPKPDSGSRPSHASPPPSLIPDSEIPQNHGEMLFSSLLMNSAHQLLLIVSRNAGDEADFVLLMMLWPKFCRPYLLSRFFNFFNELFCIWLLATYQWVCQLISLASHLSRGALPADKKCGFYITFDILLSLSGW